MKTYLNTKEAAKFLGIKVSSLYNTPWKDIPRIKKGNRVYLSVDMLNKYIQEFSAKTVRYQLLLTFEEARILRHLTEGFPALHNKLTNLKELRIGKPINYFNP